MEKVSNSELKQVIFERLKELPEMQRKVLALYYIEDMHLREIAEVFRPDRIAHLPDSCAGHPGHPLLHATL